MRALAVAAFLLVAAPARAEGIVVIGDTTSTSATSTPEGAIVRTRRPALHVEVGALLQVLVGGEPDGETGFRLARTRVIADAELERVLHLALHLELELNPRSELVDAPLADAWLGFDAASRALADVGRLRVGQMKVPFGGELAQSAEELLFVTRADGSRCLGPGAQLHGDGATLTMRESTGRDLGLRYDLDLGLGPLRLEAGAGLFGGAGPNRVGPTSPLYAARIALARGRFGDRGHLHILVAVSWSYAANSPVRDSCRFPDSPASTMADVHRVGADVRLRWRWLTLAAEGVAATLASGGIDAHALSGVVAIDVLPEFFELAARLEDYEDDHLALAGGPLAEHFLALTAGASLRYYGDRFRLQFNYTRRISRVAGIPDSDGSLVSFLMAL